MRFWKTPRPPPAFLLVAPHLRLLVPAKITRSVLCSWQSLQGHRSLCCGQLRLHNLRRFELPKVVHEVSQHRLTGVHPDATFVRRNLRLLRLHTA